MTRYCASCGTEVDERALFCPTCGQPIEDADTADLPPAPAWPDDPPDLPDHGGVAEEPPHEAPTAPQARRAPVEPAAPVAAPPPRAVPEGEPRGGPGEDDGSRRPAWETIDVPITWPVTLSGWLIGIGAFVGALAMFLPWRPPGVDGFGGFDSAVNVLMLVALLAVAAWVFFSSRMPAIPHQRLGALVIVAIGLGIGLDRVGLGTAGVGAALFVLAMLAAAIGAVLVEIGADRPLGGRPG